MKSTNQHGVHSPFIFDFVTKGLYIKNKISRKVNDHSEFKKLSKKEQLILSKVLTYFKIDEISVDLQKTSKALSKDYILFYINTLNYLYNSNLKINKENHILLVKGIYDNKKNNKIWNNFLASTPNIVSVNLFYFGVIFYRPQQAKEHFKIRV